LVEPFACDIFSLGVLLFQMIFNHQPFYEANAENVAYKLVINEQKKEFY